ncbi:MULTISPECIES: DUF305 domain-containing protein [unclassified Mycobacterium]|uniref:DUF305 domain-containing protein n=1 Tax=unclassified Mycobacterium TaxID=2642494 RepID=UPI0029C61156|nr:MULTISPECIES: DUF305 domain-containing protein [unclassified Mycobacterium]
MKSLPALLAALATALFLSSCSSPATEEHAGHDQSAPPSSSATAPAAFNDADVSFATNMIPHHQQAVEMSAMVPDRSTNPEVVKLAADISAAQGPEIETMKAFLVQWNAGGSDHQGHGDMAGGMQMDGMVDQATMTKLGSLKGPEFDTLWLQSMIGHHEGAIKMAQAELAGGANADAKTLAGQIVTGQQAEIVTMKQMLGG